MSNCAGPAGSSAVTRCRRPVQTYEQLSNYDELVARIEALRAERKTLSEIAATLNAEGFHPPKRSPRIHARDRESASCASAAFAAGRCRGA